MQDDQPNAIIVNDDEDKPIYIFSHGNIDLFLLVSFQGVNFHEYHHIKREY